MDLENAIRKLSALNASKLYNSDFLLSWEKSLQDIEMIVRVAEILQKMRKSNISTKIFDSGLAISIFRDNSTRTRYAYASAANLLGLTTEDLDEQKSQIAHGETVRETANMISFLTDFIGIRDDMYPGIGHNYMVEVANAVDEGLNNGVLLDRPNLINLQCDLDHPTQSLADLIHLKNQFGGLENLKGKKFCMSWAYSPSYGKPMSVPQGMIALLSRFGMNISLAHPPGYDLMPEVIELTKEQSVRSGGSFTITDQMGKGIDQADIVYAKSWAPLHIMNDRTRLLQAADAEALKNLERECLRENAKFIDWEFDHEKLGKTKNGNALYMHCLPADISGVNCTKGEVSESVFEKYRMTTYKEASWKPYVIAAMMLCAKSEKPQKMLESIIRSNSARILS